MREKAHGGRLMLIVLAFSLASLYACEPEPDPQPASPPTSQIQKEAAEEAAQAAQPVILALGDSLTAGFGLAVEESYPNRLQERLRAEGYPHRVVNAGVSGDTTTGGLARLDWLMRQHPDILILALGANDGLRGVAPPAMRANLAAIIERVQAAGTRILLAGMRMPSNYGVNYSRQFEAVFVELAEQYNVPLLPFLLEGVALRRELNQADGIHPNLRGTAVVTDNVWRALKPLLKK